MRAEFITDLIVTEGNYIDARAYGSDLDDVTLQAAINAIGSDERTLLISYGNWVLANNVTVPTNVTLKFNRGAVISAPGKILTINSSIESGPYQVFDVDDSGEPELVWNSMQEINVKWFGAVGDNFADDRPAIQAAINSIVYIKGGGTPYVNLGGIGGTIYLPGGTYRIKTAYTTPTDAAGAYYGGSSTQGLVFFGGHPVIVPLHIRGDGWYSTSIVADAGLGITDVLHFNNSGPTGSIREMAISGGDAVQNVVTNQSARCSGLWIGTGNNGLTIRGGVQVTDCNIEHCVHNIHMEGTRSCYLENVYCGSAGYAEVYIKGTAALYPTIDYNEDASYGEHTMTGIVFTNCKFAKTSNGAAGGIIHIDISEDMDVPVYFNNCLIEHPLAPYNAAPVYIADCYAVYFNNCDISHGQLNGFVISGATKGVYINGGNIRKIGYWTSIGSTPELCMAVYVNSTNVKEVSLVGVNFVDCAGEAIRSRAIVNKIIGCTFNNCLNGGYDGVSADAGVHATTGNKVIHLSPQTTSFQAIVMGNFFIDADGSGVGKTAIYLDNDATPADGNVKIIGNSMTLGEFATPFVSTLAAATILNYTIRDNENMIVTENSGTAIITSGSTSVVVAHGLDVTPNVGHFSIIGAEDPTNTIGAIWVDTVGAANFTVNVENDPGASHWTFGWRVSV